MLIYRKKKGKFNRYLIYPLLTIVFLIFLRQFNFDSRVFITGHLERLNLGFSSISNFIGTNDISQLKNPETVNKIIKKIPLILKNKIFARDDEKKFPTIKFKIKFKNYNQILNERKNAVKNKIGDNFNEVKAKILFDGNVYNTKLRLKGDLSDHWRNDFRMSLRVSLKNNETILGLNTFSIHRPGSRQHPHDQIFQELQNKNGNIYIPHTYMHVFVNNEDWGIMNIEEHVSKELLEKQGFKESLILKFGNEDWLRYRAKENKIKNYKISDPSLFVKSYSSKKYFKNKVNRDYFTYISEEILKDKSHIYDVESFSSSLITAMSFNSMHSLLSLNSKYYFNPYTLRIHPITTDQAQLTALSSPFSMNDITYANLPKPFPIPKYYKKVINSDQFKINLKQNLKKVRDNIMNSESIFKKWNDIFPLDEKVYWKILNENNNKINNDFYNYLKKTEDENLVQNRPNLNEAKDLLSHVYAAHYDNGEIFIYNLINDDITIHSIEKDQRNILSEKINVRSNAQKKYYPHIIKTKLFDIHDNSISIQTEYQGFRREFIIDFTRTSSKKNNPLLNKPQSNNTEFLTRDSMKNWVFKRGNWNINNPIIIDGNLTINDGTNIKFNHDSYLLVKGQLKILGTKTNKVLLEPINDDWKGIYVIESDQKSIIKNATIIGTTFFNDGLLNLTGGINFYKSDIEILDTSIISSNAEDAINIVKSKYYINNLKIENCSSDGLDSDFSTGTISNSEFKNISGDAVDFSGSEVTLFNNSFINIKDKAISAGEESYLKIKNNFFKSIGVAIASKDGSKVSAQELNIEDYKAYAFMTYVKKNFYVNKPELIINNFNISQSEDGKEYFLRQEGTYMEIDSKVVSEKKLNVKKLYKDGFVKK